MNTAELARKYVQLFHSGSSFNKTTGCWHMSINYHFSFDLIETGTAKRGRQQLSSPLVAYLTTGVVVKIVNKITLK